MIRRSSSSVPPLKIAVVAITIILLTTIVGCTPVGPNAGASSDQPIVSPLTRDQFDQVLVVLIDKSESFKDLMRKDGAGTRFLYDSVDHYFQARLTNNDILIVAQMSGNRQALLWQGSPIHLRQRFNGPAELSDELEKKSAPGGSRIYDAISDSIELILSDPSMIKSRLCFIVLSDMEQTLQDNYSTNQRLDQNLTALAKRGGVLGLYFVSTAECTKWRQKLTQFGFKDFVVEPSIHERPRLPSWE